MNQSSSTTRRSVNASVSRKKFSVARDSKVLDKTSIQPPKQTAQVFDETGKDITPRPLYQLEPGAMQTKQSKLFARHDASDGTFSDFLSTAYHTRSMSSAEPFTMSVLGSSFVSRASHSMTESVSDENEEPFAKLETLTSLSEPDIEREEQIEEHMLDKPVDIYLTETETMCFLDIHGVCVSAGTQEADALKERNKLYTEFCKNKKGDDRFVEREMQMINAPTICKQTQSNPITTEEKDCMATRWDIYDLTVGSSVAEEPGSNPDEEKPRIPDVSSTHQSKSSLQRTMSRDSATSTAYLASISSSLREMETSTVHMVVEPDPEQILHSEKFRQSLKVMERMVLMNTNQHKLAAYKGLSILKDPDHIEEEAEVTEQDTLSPALELLWTFSCELTKGYRVSSMAWNKKCPNTLAVGYGQFDHKSQRSGLVCVWSLKNLTWPERIFKCKTSVTSLDFSTSNPSQLAVGMYDGTIAIYSVKSAEEALLCDSRDCANKHMAPVWQVKWVERIQSLSGEDKRERLFSVSAEGRILEWCLHQGLDCTEIMRLKRIRNEEKKQLRKEKPLIFHWAVGLCFDFHYNDPNIYLVGTEDGYIHECSCSYTEQFLETYSKHLGPVYKVTWSPFCPDVFLSCSSDWTIQLWSKEHFSQLLSFTSIKKAVYDVVWSPRWATVFGVVNKDRVEIWDLGVSSLSPTLVSETIPGLEPTSMLFAINTDCILVGDSEGRVSVYKLRNFSAGEGTEVETMKNIVSSKLHSQL
ncbi:dynein axonemal intermediate chain 4 [Clarias gariepinus]